MKQSPHKINHGWMVPSDAVDEDYQRQVDRSTDKSERVYANALKRLEAAEQRLIKALTIKSPVAKARETKAAKMAVEARRQELIALQSMMTQTPRGSQHRGVGSYWQVPNGKAI